MIVDPQGLREARNILELTQKQAGVALGGVSQGTISRWERSQINEQSTIRGIHIETRRQFSQTANLLVGLFPDRTERMTFLHSPQWELGGQSPYQAIMEDPPNGLLLVYRLLGRMAEGIPT